MKKIIKYFCVLLFFAQTFSVSADNVFIDDTASQNDTANVESAKKQLKSNKNSVIIDCKKHNGSENGCKAIPVYSNDMINDNDVYFLEQRVYMDNNNPLYYNQYPPHIHNEFHF